ncbi:MAG: hypothetical protein ACO3HG_06235, partial [Schleiferiaceae bacterium]
MRGTALNSKIRSSNANCRCTAQEIPKQTAIHEELTAKSHAIQISHNIYYVKYHLNKHHKQAPHALKPSTLGNHLEIHPTGTRPNSTKPLLKFPEPELSRTT